MRKKKKRLQYRRRRGQTAVDPTVLDSFHQSGRRGGTSPQPKRKCEEIQPEAVFEDNVLYSPRVVTGPARVGVASGQKQGCISETASRTDSSETGKIWSGKGRLELAPWRG